MTTNKNDDMKVEIELNGSITEYKLKDSWEDVTTENFVKVANISQDENLNKTNKLVVLISELSGIDIDTLMNMSIDYIRQFEKSLALLNEPMPEYKEDYLEIDGEKYYFKSDYSKLTFGEVVSIEKI